MADVMATRAGASGLGDGAEGGTSTFDRTGLLPESGIGTDGPWLVIAPRGNPLIRLDARLLDEVGVIGHSPMAPAITGGAAAIAAAAAMLSFIPGGIVACIGLGAFGADRLREASRRAVQQDLKLRLGRLTVSLRVADGTAATRRIAEVLAPYTCDAKITRPDVYEDARRRLASQGVSIAVGARVASRRAGKALRVGDHEVFVDGAQLFVGDVGFAITDVREFASRGVNLPLPGGRVLQAAVALLVVAADERAAAGEDLAALAQRIAEYEAWSGQRAGR